MRSYKLMTVVRPVKPKFSHPIYTNNGFSLTSVLIAVTMLSLALIAIGMIHLQHLEKKSTHQQMELKNISLKYNMLQTLITPENCTCEIQGKSTKDIHELNLEKAGFKSHLNHLKATSKSNIVEIKRNIATAKPVMAAIPTKRGHKKRSNKVNKKYKSYSVPTPTITSSLPPQKRPRPRTIQVTSTPCQAVGELWQKPSTLHEGKYRRHGRSERLYVDAYGFGRSYPNPQTICNWSTVSKLYMDIGTGQISKYNLETNVWSTLKCPPGYHILQGSSRRQNIVCNTPSEDATKVRSTYDEPPPGRLSVKTPGCTKVCTLNP